jgi:hypothetical protein
MEIKVHHFTIKADTAPLLEALSILSDFLHAGEVPLQFLDRVLDLLDSPGKLSRITSITTVGTGMTIRFEPADALLALVTALRTGDLDSFFLVHGKQGFQYPQRLVWDNKSPDACGNQVSWVKQIKLSLHVEMLHCGKTHKREIKKQADGDYNAHSCFGAFETVGVRPPWFNFCSSLQTVGGRSLCFSFHSPLLLAAYQSHLADTAQAKYCGDFDTKSDTGQLCVRRRMRQAS